MTTRKVHWAQKIEVDGGVLVADVAFPAGVDPSSGRWPTLVARTPYGRQTFLRDPWIRLVDEGYVLVACDVRRRGDSDGAFAPFVEDTADGVAVIDWAATQSWSDGRVGTIGGSYDGMTQWWAARGRPAALRCMVPMAVGARGRSGTRPYLDSGIPMQYWMWWLALTSGRTVQDVFTPSWDRHWNHRPLQSLHTAVGFPSAPWRQYVDGQIDMLGPGWCLTDDELHDVDIPVLIIVGWWDDQLTLETWESLQAGPHAANKHLVVGPWDHSGNIWPRPVLGGENVTAGATDTMALVADFLARHLKDDDSRPSPPPARIWRSGAQQWEDLREYPTHSTAQPWYLSLAAPDGPGQLSTELPTEACSDSWWHDPSAPVTTLTSLDAFATSDPPHDQRYLESRSDVRSYTTPPLDTDTSISGRPYVDLTLSVDACDGDVFVWITDVHPEGQSMLPAGIELEGTRLSHRLGAARVLLTPGEIVQVRAHCQWFHHTFRAGHQIRLNVAASLAPIYAPNSGTSSPWHEETDAQPYRISLHSGLKDSPATLYLPIDVSTP